jgi:hypothetical protein
VISVPSRIWHMRNRSSGSSFFFPVLVVGTIGFWACGDDGTFPSGDFSDLCLEIQPNLISGAARDAIPALTDPPLVSVGDVTTDFLLGTDRVIGLEVGGEYIAVPHNILWWHEIVNLNSVGLAITYCPLTGSSMVFDRGATDGAELAVSGLLFNNNLVMIDRSPSGVVETLWPQMLAHGRCGPAEGRALEMVAALEIQWEDWVALHPDTRVVGRNTGFSRTYTRYPYGDYEVESNGLTIFPQPSFDSRRAPKERVLGIPFENGGGIAFPFGSLRSVGDLAVVHETLDNQDPVVVFWDGGAAAAMAYQPSASGQNLTFEVSNGAFTDVETGSEWSIEGRAISGPLVGARLAMIPEAYVSFWFAFSTFFAVPELWSP